MIFDFSKCGGCRTCEMACSYHHKGVFQPAASSLRILDKEHGSGFLLELEEEGDLIRTACDGCEGLPVPRCVEVCEEKEELENMIRQFISETMGAKK